MFLITQRIRYGLWHTWLKKEYQAVLMPWVSLKIIWKSTKVNFSQRYRINIISIFTMLLISGRDSVDAKSFYKESQIPIIGIRPIIPYCFVVSQDVEMSHWHIGSNRLQEWAHPMSSLSRTDFLSWSWISKAQPHPRQHLTEHTPLCQQWRRLGRLKPPGSSCSWSIGSR